MNTLTFKTNIKCAGCIEKTTGVLNEVAGENNWEVDTKSADKLLTITTEQPINKQALIEGLSEKGYKAEAVN